MRRARWAAGAALLLLIASSSAVARAQSGVPDVPSGPGAVVGRLVHATRPEAVAEVPVLLYALSPDGSGGLREGKSDASGNFRFDGLSTAPEIVYLVGARADDVPFGQRFRFAEGEREQRVELALSDPLADSSAARTLGASVRLERGCTHLHVLHRHAVHNPGSQVIFVPEAQRATAAPILEVEISGDALAFESLLGRDGVSHDGNRVRFWGPLYAGDQEIEFGYALPLEAASLRVGLARGAPWLELLAPRDALAVSSASLAARPEVEIDGRPHTALRAERLPDGAAIDVALALAPAAPSPLRTPRAELWVELDDAALDVNQRLEVVMPEGAQAPAAAGPLLCLAVPPQSEGLRFSESTLDAGLRRDPSGALAVVGPLPPGSSQLALSYRLPVESSGARLPLRFDRELPLLTLLVADTGVVAETQRLHRRRAVRADDRMYLQLEGFAIAADEPIDLTLHRTPPRAAPGRWATAGFALLAGAAALGFLVAPLRGKAPQLAAAGRSDALDLERDAILRSLGDLDEDLDTGKLSPEDHAALRSELRSRAAGLLLAPRAEPAEPPSASAPDASLGGARAAPFCSACGAASRPADRFCSQCGATLASGSQPG